MCYHPDVWGSYNDEEKMKAINPAKDRIFGVRGWDQVFSGFLCTHGIYL
ncbi:MAG: hypothetical protein NTW27_03510 [Deltaproteobacteria bacterium]|jgi:hypothetical protein|nr:hypothetical protein [Deltaproteobacteria bacterium]